MKEKQNMLRNSKYDTGMEHAVAHPLQRAVLIYKPEDNDMTFKHL
jgi:hypothetical protein